MKNLLLISLLVLNFVFIVNQASAETRIVRQISSIPNSEYRYNNTNLYSKDLTRIEEYLFGKNYSKESLNNRLSRVENKLFNRDYKLLPPAQRMNSIISNYKDDFENRNYLTRYYNRSVSPVMRVRNRFIGSPTGFTPSIIDTPFGGSFNPGFSRAFSSNRGYGFNNSIPAMTGAGINILH